MDEIRFGRLTFISQAPDAPGVKGSYRKRWNMVCDCGTRVVKCARTVRRGQTVSCGCYKIEQRRMTFLTHGESYSPEYRAWIQMKHRATDTKWKQAKDYALRGIRCCDAWLNSFETFLRDMGRRPDIGYSLDRIDNDRGYEPGNCRWATRQEQQINRRATNTFELEGQRLTSRQIADLHGLPRSTVHRRLMRGEVPADMIATILAKRMKKAAMSVSSQSPDGHPITS